MRKMCAIMYALLLMGAATAAAAVPNPHADRLSRYDGPQTCLGCHPDAAKEVATSLHYQQRAEPQLLKGWPKGQTAGMMDSF
jgi:hypothetical protein